jgi:hypothetical protein
MSTRKVIVSEDKEFFLELVAVVDAVRLPSGAPRIKKATTATAKAMQAYAKNCAANPEEYFV